MRIRFLAAGFAALSVASVGAATAAQAGGMQIGTGNIYSMGASIDSQLLGNVNGYAWAIAKDGKLVATNGEGKARNAQDGNLDFTANTRLEIASATKNVAAAAVLQLLEKAGISVDARVNGYLPSTWQRGAGWENVTFRMLLAHTSGLKQQGNALNAGSAWNTLFNGVQFAVSNAITPNAARLYTNMNYATLRITIPTLWKLAEPNNGQPALTSANSGAITMAYINKYLFAPAGIDGVSCQSSNTSAFIYDVANSPNAGVDANLSGGNLEACGGHRGLSMSAVDMVRFQTYMRNTNLVSPSVRNLMDNTSGHNYGELGWMPGSNNGSLAGMFFHNGDITDSGRQVHSCQAKFPGNIQAAVIINSSWDTSVSTMCGVLVNAYNAM